jgi:hypothetical protein
LRIYAALSGHRPIGNASFDKALVPVTDDDRCREKREEFTPARRPETFFSHNHSGTWQAFLMESVYDHDLFACEPTPHHAVDLALTNNLTGIDVKIRATETINHLERSRSSPSIFGLITGRRSK